MFLCQDVEEGVGSSAFNRVLTQLGEKHRHICTNLVCVMLVVLRRRGKLCFDKKKLVCSCLRAVTSSPVIGSTSETSCAPLSWAPGRRSHLVAAGPMEEMGIGPKTWGTGGSCHVQQAHRTFAVVVSVGRIGGGVKHVLYTYGQSVQIHSVPVDS